MHVAPNEVTLKVTSTMHKFKVKLVIAKVCTLSLRHFFMMNYIQFVIINNRPIITLRCMVLTWVARTYSSYIDKNKLGEKQY